MSDHYYETNWSGDYPTLCSGLWILYRDGEELDIDIPFNHSERAERGIPAGTFGTYPTWHFSDDWEEVWEDYEDGLPCDEWCSEHEEWLSTFADEEDWHIIFEAFAENDWRSNSCGGCI